MLSAVYLRFVVALTATVNFGIAGTDMRAAPGPEASRAGRLAGLSNSSSGRSRPTVLAFYNQDQHTPSFWLDYDWDILTHVVVYGYSDPNMLAYAKSRNVSMLRAFSTSFINATDATVRSEVARDLINMAPKPYGPQLANESYDGVFFGIECTLQPCPWLADGQSKGMAQIFAAVKRAWPTCVLSLYVSGNAGARISGSGTSGTTATYPYQYSLAQLKPMVPSLDQVVFGGYSSVNYTYLQRNTIAGCTPDVSLPRASATCGGVNGNQTLVWALRGARGAKTPCQDGLGAQPAFPCSMPAWSDVVPKEKLVYALGWYNAQYSLQQPSSGPEDPELGGSPSFCAVAHWLRKHGAAINMTLDGSGTWVFDRVDTAGRGWRVWFDDARSLGPKYALVREAGWGGVGLWLASGMFPNALLSTKPAVFDTYCPNELREMWRAIRENFVEA